MRHHARALGCILLAAAVLAVAAPVRAQAISAAQKEAARERYGRGVERLRAKDYAGAVAEFDQAYQLAPYAVVLFNLGIAYARLGRPVEAAGAFEKVLADPGTLSAARIAQAHKELRAQNERIGSLAVAVSEAGASVRVDGIEIGRAPLGEALRLAAGTHFVEAVKRGYAPARKEVRVPAEARTELRLDLEPSEHAMGQLWVRSPLPEAEIWLDGVRIGRTPLEQSIPVLPGQHTVELEREAYRTARKTIAIRAGATAELNMEPELDPAAVERAGGNLLLEGDGVDEMVVSVDGRRIGRYAGPLRLAPGVHVLAVERGGFYPRELRVHIAPRQSHTRQVLLDPTAETIAAHEREVALFRGFAIGTLVAGAGLVGGGIGYTVWNEGRIEEHDELVSTPRCLTEGNLHQDCKAAADKFDAAVGRRPIGYAMIGVGGALAVTGILLFALGPDPDAYEPPTDEAFDAAVLPELSIGSAGACLTVRGRY